MSAKRRYPGTNRTRMNLSLYPEHEQLIEELMYKLRIFNRGKVVRQALMEMAERYGVISLKEATKID